MASISEPFIRRPVGTTLLAIGLFLVGIVAYEFLPVASVPNVDFPMIRVFATRPGADPSVMAATVAAPLERKLGQISGVEQITSTSSLGTTSIQLQFSIGRNIDRAGRDVQAAINASLADLPSDLPSLPRFRKANPAAAPVFVLALTSKTISTSAMYDVADTVLAQRISQVPGVGEVTVSGADQPAVRIALNPVALSNAGIATDDVRLAIINANPLGPVGIFNGGRQSETLSVNRQMRTAAEFRDIIIKSSTGNFVRLSDVAEVEDSVRNSRSIAWFNKQPAVLIQITKQGDANVIDTVDRVRALIPEIKQWISRRRRDFHPGRSHRYDPRQRARHAADAACHRVSGDAGRVRVPAPDNPDNRRRRLGAAGARRHLRRDVACRFLDRQPVADGARDLGRLRGRRRHRHDREHVPQPRTGHGALCGGDRGRQTDRIHGIVDQPVADRSIHAADLHGRHRRAAVARVFVDADLCHRGLHGGVAHDHADDLRALHQGSDIGPRHLAGSAGRRYAVEGRAVLRAHAARGLGLSAADARRVLRHHRADGDALYQDAKRLLSGRR